jgi:hypothetical protein
VGKRMVNIAGLEVEVVPDQTVIDSGVPIGAVRLADAHQPLDEKYVPGTQAGYFCWVCNQECILAPSGQAIYAVGKNPLVCMVCILAMGDKEQ